MAASKAVKNNKKPKNENGKSKSSSTKSKPASSSSVPLTLTALVAVLAFGIGVLTPPLRHLIHELSSSTESSSSKASILSNNIPIPHVPCTSTNLDNYLHASPVPGLHILCIEALHLDNNGNEIPSADDNDTHYSHQRQLQKSNSLRITFYKRSHVPKLKRRIIIRASEHGVRYVRDMQWRALYGRIVTELGLSSSSSSSINIDIERKKNKQPWAIYTALGQRIVGESDHYDTNDDDASNDNNIVYQMASSEMLLLTEGGNWIWPGVQIGFRRNVTLSTLASQSQSQQQQQEQVVTIETLSLQPLVLSITGFLNDDECDYISKTAEPRIRYSQVSLMDKDKGKQASEWRTSQSTFLNSAHDDILTEIDNRVSSLTRIPKTHGEYVQVLRYGPGEKYDAHHDYFNPSLYKHDVNTLKLIENGKRNRFATVFWYLTDVSEGGETIFPRAGGKSPPGNYGGCEVGLKVKPVKGKVIIFYSLNAAGDMDEYSLHGACKVGEGNVKWAANKWIW